MAKVVKFCAVCEEGFAEKFGFCPNCGGALAAYELNPVAEKTNVGATSHVEAKASAPILNESPAVAEKTTEPVMETFSTNGDEAEFLELENLPKNETAAVVDSTPVRSSFNQDFNQDFNQTGYKQNGNGASNGYQKTMPTNQTKYDDGAYHITFVEEKNASGRNMLLLGSFLLVTTLALGGVVYSLFERTLSIGSLGDDSSMLAYIGPVDPEPIVEEPPPPKKNPDKAGGGGGGGREEETPTSKGRLASQMPEPPMITPTKTIVQKDFELKQIATTVGNKQIKATEEAYGDPASKYNLASDGMGSGGGQGSGRGTGQGSGRGTGQGSGNGSGSGSGIGDGNGGGTGSGDEGRDAPPPAPKPKGVTQAVNIISKPRPQYTDAARQNQVMGVVRLRVTFLASGQIGSVAPISGLSYGLTEQAIAAAKQIRFEPAKKDGVPQTVIRQIEYSFSIF